MIYLQYDTIKMANIRQYFVFSYNVAWYELISIKTRIEEILFYLDFRNIHANVVV